MNKVFEKIIEKLEERTSFLSDCTKYGNKDAKQQEKSYSTMMMYEVADLVDDLIEIVKQEAEQYEECYKDCGQCEAYNKEKHYCPKFCNVIKETVKEIEENHNDWISCSERLPEEHKQYDITTKNEVGIHSDTAIYNPFVGMWFWDESESKHIEIEVLAWAEKRDSYQPKGE